MRPIQPPAAATWLLNKFGCTNDALKGDLVEEYGQGRSIAWYWRQVLIAIAVGFSTEIRAHKLLALRAIITGWGVIYLLDRAVGITFWKWYGHLLLAHGLTPAFWLRHSYTYAVGLVSCIYGAASGWIVGICNHEHRSAMVLTFLLSVQLWSLPEFFRLTEDVATNQRFLPYLFAFVTRLVLISIGILLGGLWGSSRQSDPQRS